MADLSPALSREDSPARVRTPSRGSTSAAASLCPVCHAVLLRERQQVCSGKCRITRSRQKHASIQHLQDVQLQLLVRTALESLEEVHAILQARAEAPPRG